MQEVNTGGPAMHTSSTYTRETAFKDKEMPHAHFFLSWALSFAAMVT